MVGEYSKEAERREVGPGPDPSHYDLHMDTSMNYEGNGAVWLSYVREWCTMDVG